MKLGQNIKNVSYMGYRTGVLYGRDMKIIHLLSGRKSTLHQRDKREVECGPWVSGAFREADRVNGLSYLVNEFGASSDAGLPYITDAINNAYTRGRHELADQGRN